MPPLKKSKRRKPLSSDAILIRFSQSDPKHVMSQIDKCKRLKGFWGLSLFGENGYSAEKTCEIVRFPSNWMRIVTAGTLREAGFRPRRQGKTPHVVLKWAERPTEDEIRRLLDLFAQWRRTLILQSEEGTMTISGVDFHIRDNEGRIVALVPPADLALLSVGQMVWAEDYEGNRVKAEVAKILPAKEAVCLVPQPGFEPSKKADWLGKAINY